MRYLFVLTFALLSFTASVQADDITVESKVTEATVYNDRATVLRRGQVKIPAGKHNILFKRLPVSLYADSLRIDGQSTANVTFGALSHKRESFEDYVVPKEKELNAQLVLLQDQKKIYNADKQALRIAKEFLETLGKQAALRTSEDIAEIKLNPESWSAAADALADKMSQNMQKSLKLGIQIRDVDQKIKKIQNDLRQLRTGNKQTYVVTIPYESDRETTLDIELSYQLPNVSWQPIYDARLDVQSKSLDLIQYGSVWQRTGEDWTDVELTLSTAQPSRGAGLPDLHTRWLSMHSTIETRKRGKAIQSFSANMSGLAQDAAPDYAEIVAESVSAPVMARKASFNVAKINTEGFIGEYKITGPATVKSDGTKVKLLVGAFETEDALQVQIKPQLSNDAFLVSKTKLKGDAPILPGQVSLFRDGAYIGQTYMNMLRPDEVAELAFGIDDNVTVKRNTLKDERSEAGLISKEILLERHYITEVQNLHKTPIQIAVLEAIPASRDKRIKVEIITDQTTPGYQEDLKNVKGITRWMTTLEPKQKVDVLLGLKVSWPKDHRISGL